jgi:hypothetical protein
MRLSENCLEIASSTPAIDAVLNPNNNPKTATRMETRKIALIILFFAASAANTGHVRPAVMPG